MPYNKQIKRRRKGVRKPLNRSGGRLEKPPLPPVKKRKKK